MKIDKLAIDGFGHFHGRELRLASGLNVIHGENEAGKSTLLAFVRAVLYGFGRAEPRFEPGQGTHGGTLWLSGPGGGAIGVRRTWRKSAKIEGELTVLGPHKEPLPASRLTEVLGGADRNLFCQLFSFNLDELADFKRVADESSVAEALFAAGTTGARRLPVVTAELKKRSEALFGLTAAAKRPLNEALQALREVRVRLEDLGDRPAQYFALCARRDDLAGEEERLSRELGRVRSEVERLGALVQAAPALRDAAALREALGALPEVLDGFPANGLGRLEEALGRRRRALSEQREARGLAAALDAELERLRAGRLSPDVLGALRAAHDGWAGWAATARGLPARRASLDARRREALEALAALGLSRPGEAIDAGSAAQAQLASLGAERSRAQASEREADARAKAAGQRLEEADEELARNAAAAEGLSDLPASELDRRRAAVERHARLEAEARQVETRRDALRLDAATAQAGVGGAEPVPAAAVWGVALGVVVLSALFALTLGPQAAIVAGVMGALLTVAIAWMRARQGQGASQARAEADARRQRVAQALDEAEQRLGELDRERAAALEAARVASVSALAALADDLPRLGREVARREALSEERAALVRRREEQVREVTRAQAARDEAVAAHGAAREAFARFANERGLPPGVEPEAALTLLSGAGQAQAKLRALEGDADALAADQRQVEMAAAQLRAAEVRAEDDQQVGGPVAQLRAAEALAEDDQQAGATVAQGRVAEAGADLVEAPRLDVEATFAAVKAALDGQQALATATSQAERRLEDLRPRLEALAAELGQAETDVGALLSAAGAPDEETFRRQASDAARREALKAELTSAVRSAEAAARRPLAEAQAGLEAAGGEAAARARHEALEVELSALAKRQLEVSGERGEVRTGLAALETDAEAGRLRAEEERLGGEIRALATRYARDRLGLQLLSRARQRFEEEQQPRVIQLASAHFAALTGFRYARVFVPAEEALNDLCVVDGQGETKRAGALSRGTREQLYLAFRLAVVEDFGETRVPLPLVLDDILVNFDPRRARNAAKVLARLAARHQVLAFTCHAWMRDLLAEHGAEVVELSAPAVQLAALGR